MIKKRFLELRALAVNEKELEERKIELIDEMQDILKKCKEEKRSSCNDEESNRIGEIESELKNIETTLRTAQTVRSLDVKKSVKGNKEEEQRALDEANFLKFVRGEERALDVANNGGIIPTSIANKIIETVKELSPIYSMATIYNVGGDLVFPVYNESSSSIKAAYSEDLTELTEGTGKFTTVKLTNYIVGCLAKVSKSLMNRTDFDLIGFIVRKVAQAIAEFLEKELIKGTSGKISGISSTNNVVTSNTVATITTDDLIDLQMAVPEVYQANAKWIMHKNTLKILRKLKDSDGNYILNRDLTNGFGWSLLGKTVHVTESADQVSTGEKAVFYGDYSGLAVKLAQNVELQMLLEKYATQHAVGVVAYVEADAKIIEPQKIAALNIK